MEIVISLFGTTIEFRIGATVEEEMELSPTALNAQVEHFGFVPADPAFPEFDWSEDEDV